MHDPEITKIRDSLIVCRNYESDPVAIAAIDDAIQSLNRHPLIREQRSAALDELARLGQEFDRM